MIDRSIIGRRSEPVTMTVERGKVMEFARSILDDNPMYFTPDPAIPLTFVVTLAHWTTQDGVVVPGLDLSRVLHGGQEFEYLAPIQVGDTLTSTGQVVDIYEKAGSRGGTMTFIVSESSYVNQHGQEVLRSRGTLIETSQAAN